MVSVVIVLNLHHQLMMVELASSKLVITDRGGHLKAFVLIVQVLQEDRMGANVKVMHVLSSRRWWLMVRVRTVQIIHCQTINYENAFEDNVRYQAFFKSMDHVWFAPTSPSLTTRVQNVFLTSVQINKLCWKMAVVKIAHNYTSPNLISWLVSKKYAWVIRL